MSATLDTAAVSSFLGGCPVVDVPGRLHPLDVSYAPGTSVADAVERLTASTPGDVLCFLPGAFEIRRAMDEIAARGASRSATCCRYGSLEAAAQDAAPRKPTGSGAGSSSLPTSPKRRSLCQRHGGGRLGFTQSRSLMPSAHR
jgi:HrpA-like RNA helicase